MQRFSTIRDLAEHMFSGMFVDDDNISQSDVTAAILRRRAMFARYEDIDKEALASISRAVWSDLTHGATWPFPATWLD